MDLIFISTTAENLQNLPHLNFDNEFTDQISNTIFTYRILKEKEAIVVISSGLQNFFRGRLGVVFEDERYNALKSFIENCFSNLDLKGPIEIEKSYYAFHSHYDIFDDDTFCGLSNSLSDQNHIVWGFSHQGADRIYQCLLGNEGEIVQNLIQIMGNNSQ